MSSRSHLMAVLAVLLCACGAKTQLITWDAEPVPPECQTDDDCNDGVYCDGVEACREGRCIGGAPIVCTDGDECTDDSCDEPTRVCLHRPATRDADGDGYNGPRAGHQPGDPGSCGNDCNDMNAAIHPAMSAGFLNNRIDKRFAIRSIVYTPRHR